MWRPTPRVRHALPDPGWPTAQEASRSRWFSPLRAGPLHLLRRTWVPAMVPWRASPEGEVTADVLDWYARFARGRPGALVVEATGIRDVPSGPLLRIGHDRFVPGLKHLADVVRQNSDGQTRLLIQLIDFLAVRRRPTRERYLGQYLQIEDRHRQWAGASDDSTVRARLLAASDEDLTRALSPREQEDLSHGFRERVTDTHLPHVAALPQVLPGLFADAARRAERAGFDGVELHFAHAYTMASFLSALNTRSDGYGSDRSGRLRLPLEVLTATRGAVSDEFAVGCRMLSREIVPGGSDIDDVCHFAVQLAGAGLDFLSLSRGGRFEDAAQPPVGEAVYPYTGRSGYECMPTVHSDTAGPFGRNVEDTGRVRAALRGNGLDTPVVVAGGICSFTQVEAILAAGQADVVASARQSLADPDWFEKVRQGRGAQVRRCAFTNSCEGLDQRHKQVTCKLWDRSDLDQPGVRLSRDGRRRLTAPADSHDPSERT